MVAMKKANKSLKKITRKDIINAKNFWEWKVRLNGEDN